MYVFSLIVAILLLILKSKSSEINYLIARILLFVYSAMMSVLLFIPKFTIGLLKKIFNNSVADPDEFNILFMFTLINIIKICLFSYQKATNRFAIF